MKNKKLSRQLDLNQRPTVYETVALPLSYVGKRVVGIGPASYPWEGYIIPLYDTRLRLPF